MIKRTRLCIAMATVISVMAMAASGAPKSALPGNSVVQKMPPVGVLAYHLYCKAAMPPGQMIYRVGVGNDGQGAVPAGTKIHWVLAIQPGGTVSGDYAFTAALAPNDHVWVPSSGLPLSWQSDTCTVTVAK